MAIDRHRLPLSHLELEVGAVDLDNFTCDSLRMNKWARLVLACCLYTFLVLFMAHTIYIGTD